MSSILCLKQTRIIHIGRHRSDDDIRRTINWDGPEYLGEEVVELQPLSKENGEKSEHPVRVSNGYLVVVKAGEQWSSVERLSVGVW